MAAAEARGIAGAMLNRLRLDPGRVAGIVAGLRAVAAQPDPLGAVIAAWEMPSGLRIRRVRSPIGVIGVIYESRPNVTADAGALCLRSGNAVILRGARKARAHRPRSTARWWRGFVPPACPRPRSSSCP